MVPIYMTMPTFAPTYDWLSSPITPPEQQVTPIPSVTGPYPSTDWKVKVGYKLKSVTVKPCQSQRLVVSV